MKTTKRIGIAASIVFLLFLAGCGEGEVITSTTKAFVGGSEGLEISFLSGLPPDEVFDIDNPFSISVQITNKGEHDIDSAQDVDVSITGINPSDFGVSATALETNPTETLSGVRIDGAGNVLSGDYVTVDFPEMNYYTTVAGAIPFTIRANVCYEYGTRAQGKLCVRKDLKGVTGEAGICDPNRQVPAENSAAPIQITNIRQNVAGSNKIDFFFTIKKMGKTTDSLYKSGSSCDPGIPNKDVVFVDVTDTGLGTLTCSGLKDGTPTSGFITLFSGEREVRCSQVLNTLDDFEKVVEINLKYAYKQFIDREIKIKHTE